MRKQNESDFVYRTRAPRMERRTHDWASLVYGVGFCVFAFVVMILWMFTYINLGVNPAQPYCPQEDSCYADYDGPSRSWIIYEGERQTPEQVLLPND